MEINTGSVSFLLLVGCFVMLLLICLGIVGT